MTKFVAPNSCKYCEILERSHWSRSDGLHPRGVVLYSAPDNKLRKQRMLRNRELRHISMNETESYTGKWIRYHGSNDLLHGTDFQVLDENASSVKFDAGIFGILWRNKSAVSTPFTKDSVVSNFMEPHAASIEVIDNEINRLKTRIAELETAKKVLASL